jgi:hypothetical protein
MRTVRGRKVLTLAQQHLFLRASPILSGGEGKLTATELIWKFDACPDPLSRTYRLRLRYTLYTTPHVAVVSHNLRALSEGRTPPHLYHDPDRLCLYMPGGGEWDQTQRLDQTIVPWSFLWLAYFEHWLATDEWGGGGEHPDPNAPCTGNRAERRRAAADRSRSFGLSPTQ